MRKPGERRAYILRPLRRAPATGFRHTAGSAGVAHAADGVHPVLHSRPRLDRVDCGAGVAEVPAEPDGSLSCLSGTLSFRGVVDGRYRAAAHALWNRAYHAA